MQQKKLQFISKAVQKTEIDGKDAYRFIISSEGIDRYGDIVRMNGAMLDNFRNNPIVLYNHNSSTYPIGRAHNLVVTDNNLQADVVFHELTAESKLVKQLVHEGYLKATSIGFMPLEYQEVTPTDEQKINLPKNSKITEYKRWELLEFSIVNIPANPEAVMENNLFKNLDEIMKEKNIEIAYDEKAGRTISKANLDKLRKAYQSIGEVIKPYMENEEEKEVMENEEEKEEKNLSKRLDAIELTIDENIQAMTKILDVISTNITELNLKADEVDLDFIEDKPRRIKVLD